MFSSRRKNMKTTSYSKQYIIKDNERDLYLSKYVSQLAGYIGYSWSEDIWSNNLKDAFLYPTKEDADAVVNAITKKRLLKNNKSPAMFSVLEVSVANKPTYSNFTWEVIDVTAVYPTDDGGMGKIVGGLLGVFTTVELAKEMFKDRIFVTYTPSKAVKTPEGKLVLLASEKEYEPNVDLFSFEKMQKDEILK
jgi:hypothetical protein